MKNKYIHHYCLESRSILALCIAWQKFLVTLNRGYKTESPSLCFVAITGLIVEQSSKNCTGSMAKHVLAKVESLGNPFRKFQQSSNMSALVTDMDGQDSKKDSTVPLWLSSEPQHDGKEQKPSLFHGTQCPDRASTLYLPDSSLAWVVAFSTSQGEEPQVVKMG